MDAQTLTFLGVMLTPVGLFSLLALVLMQRRWMRERYEVIMPDEVPSWAKGRQDADRTVAGSLWGWQRALAWPMEFGDETIEERLAEAAMDEMLKMEAAARLEATATVEMVPVLALPAPGQSLSGNVGRALFRQVLFMLPWQLELIMEHSESRLLKSAVADLYARGAVVEGGGA